MVYIKDKIKALGCGANVSHNQCLSLRMSVVGIVSYHDFSHNNFVIRWLECFLGKSLIMWIPIFILNGTVLDLKCQRKT